MLASVAFDSIVALNAILSATVVLLRSGHIIPIYLGEQKCKRDAHNGRCWSNEKAAALNLVQKGLVVLV